MTLAGISPAGALIVRAGEPKVLRIARVDGAGVRQAIEGRTYKFLTRRSSLLAPLRQVDAELSGDGTYLIVAIDAALATTIYEDGRYRALSYDIVETTGGATVSRYTARLKVEPAPELPSDVVPVWIDLPFAEVLIAPDAVLITDRGAQGFSAEQRAFDPGDPDGPASDSVEDFRLWLFSAKNDAETAAGLSSADRVAAAADRVQTGADRVATAADRAATAADRVQTGADRTATGGDRVATAADRTQTAADRIAADLAAASAAAAAPVYADEATGRAAVADGVQFRNGTSDGLGVEIRSRTNSTTSVLIATVPTKAAVDAATVADAADRARGSILLLPGDVDPGTAFLAVDERGRRIQGIASDGSSLVTPPDPLAGTVMAFLPGDTADAPVARFGESGFLLPGGVSPATGAVDVRRQAAPAGIAYVSGATPNRQLKLFRGAPLADLTLSPAGHDPDLVWQGGETISYRRNGADSMGVTGTRVTLSVARPPLVAGTTKLSFAPVYGQSNSNGGFATNAISLTPAQPLRALMFGYGARLTQSAIATPLPFDDVAGLRDLFEENSRRISGPPGETPCSGTAYGLTALLPVAETVICNSFGVGGQSINALKKGSQPYANLLYAVQQAHAFALAAGLARAVVPRLFWIQGEADAAMALATYKGLLDTLQSDLTADVQAITGQAEQVVFYCAQTWSAGATNNVPQALLDLHVASPARFRCTGGLYPFVFKPDNVHLDSAGTRQRGEDDGRRAARLELGTSAETCLYATAASVSGSTLTIAFAGAEGALAFDTSVVADPGQYGFAITQASGTPPSLSGFAISGSTVTATLAAALGASPKLTIARTPTPGGGGPTLGPRSCLRDTVAGARSDGTARHKYAAHQIIDIA